MKKHIAKMFLWVGLSICTTILVAQESITGAITHDGLERDYILHFPPDFDVANELPLVFNLHGYTNNAALQQSYSQMDVVSDEENFIVCYPNGIGASWNAGLPNGSAADDVGFLSNLIDTLHEQYNINLNRVYSCGMSNGGYMSYKLACELSDKITAIASVTGSIVPGNEENCFPGRVVPTMEIHGTSDPTVPYNGNFYALPIEEVVDFWVEHNACLDEPNIIDVPNDVVLDLCTAQRIEYINCENEAEVVFYKIQNGAHTWPGASFIAGVTNQDFDASEEIWKFFNRFDLQGAITATNNDLQTTGIQLFPNPAKEVVYLKNLPLKTQQIQIVDAAGRLVKSIKNIKQEELEIEVNDLNRGFYWINIQAANSIELLRLVIVE